MFSHLGIDWGEKRVGFALGNKESQLILPHGVVANDSVLLAYIGTLCTSYPITSIVCGYPTSFTLQKTAVSQSISHFTENLKRYISEKFPHITVTLYNERGTTQKALQDLAHVPKPQQLAFKDSVSASKILETFFQFT